jgi:hypothetical protein
VDASELAGLAERTGIAADPRAGHTFRLAAVRLSEQEPETDALVEASSDAARLLISLSLAEATDELRRLLTPDPADLDVTWSVEFFEIGDLTPSATREFVDPVEALAAVADCADETHAAAELVASTVRGLRWTAISRTHERVLFQLPGRDTVVTTSAEALGDAATGAMRRWRKRLADWSAHSGSDRDVEVIAGLEPIGPSPASTAVLDERFGVLEQRLAGIEESINGLSLVVETLTLAVQVREAIPPDAVQEDIATVFAGLRAGLTPLTNEVVRRLGSMERHVQADLARTTGDLRDDIAQLRDAVASLRGDLAAPVDLRR